ncbi:hypothetical protein GJ496_007220 [Pomphorhynchus laevis]|nr:hypothetical protein GJ496_007220 [Pomphorhynchus laevis]
MRLHTSCSNTPKRPSFASRIKANVDQLSYSAPLPAGHSVKPNEEDIRNQALTSILNSYPVNYRSMVERAAEICQSKVEKHVLSTPSGQLRVLAEIHGYMSKSDMMPANDENQHENTFNLTEESILNSSLFNGNASCLMMNSFRNTGRNSQIRKSPPVRPVSPPFHKDDCNVVASTPNKNASSSTKFNRNRINRKDYALRCPSLTDVQELTKDISNEDDIVRRSDRSEPVRTLRNRKIFKDISI